MDLRSKLNGSIERAETVLNYQPFILSDDVQTGVAYSWARAGDFKVSPKLVQRKQDSPEEWEIASAANGMLRAMYDDLLDEVHAIAPQGSLLDIACNNGYFPVGAALRGMRGVGLDLGHDYAKSIAFLNDILGTKANFLNIHYDSFYHRLPLSDKFDVVVLSAIMCHMPDPLFLLREAAKVTKKALLFWGQVIETEAQVIAYRSPHKSLSSLTEFPHCFNDNTRISLGMFKEASKLLGFAQVIQIEPKPSWLSAKLPSGEILENPARFKNVYADDLHEELSNGSGHAALMLVR